MTCKDCLHSDVCVGYTPTDLDRDVWHYCREGKADQIPDIEERCSSFKDRTKYVEVVRCKDCKKISPSVTAIKDSVWCREFRAYMPCDGFCSYGERREGD